MGAKKKNPAPNSQLSTFTSALLAVRALAAVGDAVTAAGTAGRRADSVAVEVGLAVQVVEHTLVGGRRVVLRHLGVVQVEGRTLGPDARDGDEVVPRRRARGRPLQPGAVAPGVGDLYQRRGAPRL